MLEFGLDKPSKQHIGKIRAGIGARPDDAHLVTDPDNHGMVKFVENGKAISMEKKPLEPRSIFSVSVI